jgi:hypothetical protein
VIPDWLILCVIEKSRMALSLSSGLLLQIPRLFKEERMLCRENGPLGEPFSTCRAWYRQSVQGLAPLRHYERRHASKL